LESKSISIGIQLEKTRYDFEQNQKNGKTVTLQKLKFLIKNKEQRTKNKEQRTKNKNNLRSTIYNVNIDQPLNSATLKLCSFDAYSL